MSVSCNVHFLLQCLRMPLLWMELSAAWSCFHFPLSFFSPLPVWAAWPSGRADHGAAVRQHAAGLQRGAVQETYCHAEAAQEALPRRRGQWHRWQIWEVALGAVVLHHAEKWVSNLHLLKKSTCTLSSSVGGYADFAGDKHFASSRAMEEVGVQWSVSSSAYRLVPIKMDAVIFKI